VAVKVRKRRFNEEVWKIMTEATRKRGEKATAVEQLRVGIKSASKSRDAEAKFEASSDVSSRRRREGRQESEQSQKISRV
jgi:hypothetical protein